MLNTAIKSRKEQVWDAFHDKKFLKKKGMGMMRQSLVTRVASYLWGEREGKNKQNTYHLITEQHITTLQFMKQILSQRELEQAHNISELNGASQTNIS